MARDLCNKGNRKCLVVLSSQRETRCHSMTPEAGNKARMAGGDSIQNVANMNARNGTGRTLDVARITVGKRYRRTV